MNRVDACEQQVAALFGERPNTGEGNNPELIQMLQRLIFGQISQIGPLDDQARELITCVVLSAYQTLPQLRVHARAALHVGLTPLTLREAVYGCMPLIGCPRTLNAIAVVDEVLAEHGHSLPLERAASVREETRETMGREMSAAVGGEKPG